MLSKIRFKIRFCITDPRILLGVFRKTGRVRKDVTVNGDIKKNIMEIMSSQFGRFLGGWKSIFKIFFFGHF